MTTIYDISEKSGVSIATVSKVINNKDGVSEKTRRKVKKVMQELNYYPNTAASVLMGKNTKTIGLLIPDLANPFFSQLAKQIEEEAHEVGYNIIICSTEYSTDKEVKYIHLLKKKNVDGLIFATGFESSTILEKLLEENFPFVVVARDFPSLDFNVVTIEDYNAGKKVGSFLLENGHSNIGLIAVNVWSNRERKRGFCDQMNKNDIEKYHFFTDVNDDHIESGYNSTKTLLSMDVLPTAIFACNDLLAIGAIRAIYELQLRIPEDISIIGFDNSNITKIINPSLTVMAQPMKELGIEVIDLIIKNIKNKNMMKKKIILTPKLLKNGTVKNIISKY